MPHPAYSPDLAPSDYGLFRSMEHFLRGRRFEDMNEVKAACQEFFDSKEPEWYRGEIRDRNDKVKQISKCFFSTIFIVGHHEKKLYHRDRPQLQSQKKIKPKTFFLVEIIDFEF